MCRRGGGWALEGGGEANKKKAERVRKGAVRPAASTSLRLAHATSQSIGRCTPGVWAWRGRVGTGGGAAMHACSRMRVLGLSHQKPSPRRERGEAKAGRRRVPRGAGWRPRLTWVSTRPSAWGACVSESPHLRARADSIAPGPARLASRSLTPTSAPPFFSDATPRPFFAAQPGPVWHCIYIAR